MSTRIIAGTHKGRRIEVVGDEVTRPTSDRVKEALFSSLDAEFVTWDKRRVIDLFAGSGGLGFEVLSRGASEVAFFEKDSKAFAILQKNAKALGLENSTSMRRLDVLKEDFLASLQGVYDLILLDPPYRLDFELVLSLITKLEEAGHIKTLGLIVYEHGKTDKLIESYTFKGGARLMHLKRKRYGQTFVDIYEYVGKSND